MLYIDTMSGTSVVGCGLLLLSVRRITNVLEP